MAVGVSRESCKGMKVFNGTMAETALSTPADTSETGVTFGFSMPCCIGSGSL